MLFRRSRRGYTTAEILISSFLAIGLSAIVSVTLVSTSRVTGDTVTDTKVQQESRALAEVLGQFIRSAKPLGVCLDAISSAQSSCKVIAEEDHPFVLASLPTSNSMAFYSYTNAASTSGDGEGYAPDMVKIVVSPEKKDCGGEECYQLAVWLYCNSAILDGTLCAPADRGGAPLRYTDSGAASELPRRPGKPDTDKPDEQERVIYVSNPNPFSYLDAEGNELCRNSDCQAELASIAVVRITNTTADPDKPQPQPLLIPLPSRGFRG